MSPFWSGWVIALIIFNLGVTLFLFVWGLKVKIPTEPDGTSGHVWAHGVLREGVKNLPKWWIALSGGMFACGFIYLALYPGFGRSKGILGWTSQLEVARDTAANELTLGPLMRRYSTLTVEDLSRDPTALGIGQRLFIDNCAACHGRLGHGNPLLGAPNLTDDDWLYGGDGKSMLTSIEDGRRGVMPPFVGVFGEAGVANLANYVRSLSNSPHDASKAAAGKPLFTVCSACHGPEGKGNIAIGAPNLTDHVWLYGGDIKTIEETIRNGRGGVMPAWRTRLDPQDVRVIAAWVYAQSHGHAVLGP
ncbi:MAG TPA: cytochrome-c oxidase, cbb3-type subunit III [Steroidobacteraceae bacterium]|nr:cytochrome-c oxidase, cbb3-type subunit III [Steroidobacteraceae bacterium]